MQRLRTNPVEQFKARRSGARERDIRHVTSHPVELVLPQPVILKSKTGHINFAQTS